MPQPNLWPLFGLCQLYKTTGHILFLPNYQIQGEQIQLKVPFVIPGRRRLWADSCQNRAVLLMLLCVASLWASCFLDLKTGETDSQETVTFTKTCCLVSFVPSISTETVNYDRNMDCWIHYFLLFIHLLVGKHWKLIWISTYSCKCHHPSVHFSITNKIEMRWSAK